MDKNTALVGGIFLLVILVVVVLLSSRKAPTAAPGPAASNGWDALIGLGKNAADAYSYA